MFFDVLSKSARLTENPFGSIQRRKLQTNSRRVLTLEELVKVITKAEGELKLLFQIGTFTGLRLGDAATLQWEEIDLDKKLIKRIPRKTASRSRKQVILGISHPLHEALSEVALAQRTGYVVPYFAERYQKPNGTGNVTRIIQKHFLACGIRVHAEGTGYQYHYEGKIKKTNKNKRAIVEVGFHSLRHSWVTYNAMNGAPMAVIQSAVGHANPAMTNYYVHTTEKAALEVANTFTIPELSAPVDVEAMPLPDDSAKNRLHKLIDRLSDDDLLKALTLMEQEIN